MASPGLYLSNFNAHCSSCSVDSTGNYPLANQSSLSLNSANHVEQMCISIAGPTRKYIYGWEAHDEALGEALRYDNFNLDGNF